jgi:hypothetical protein
MVYNAIQPVRRCTLAINKKHATLYREGHDEAGSYMIKQTRPSLKNRGLTNTEGNHTIGEKFKMMGS